MEFSSLTFLFIFLPVFLLLFSILKKEAHNSFLLMASLVFYAWGDTEFVGLLLLSILGNYLLGLLVEALAKRHPANSNRHPAPRGLFLLAVIFNLGLLVYFKYTHFIADILGLPKTTNPIHLPIGISFYTFQALSFLIDIYRKTAPMDKNPVNFGLYMAFFPKLAMGPITPYHQLRTPIQNPGRSIRLEDIAEGVKRFILGLGKKVLVADALAKPVQGIFAVPAADQTAGLAWLGILCFYMQVYYDFSGYTDMAIGLGRMCGFSLPENFHYPYQAKSIKEFWRRWHISLAKWLRDYLFLPIAYAVSRKIKNPRLWGIKAENWAYFAGAIITFTICGLWHGAAWTFLVWGVYFGLLLVIEHAFLGKRVKRLRTPWKLLYCQLLVMIGWVVFRSDSLGYAISYLKALAGFGTGDGSRYYPAYYFNPEVLVFLIIGIIGAGPLFPRLKVWLEERKNRFLNPGLGILYHFYLVGVFLLSAMVMASGTYNPFIYFRF